MSDSELGFSRDTLENLGIGIFRGIQFQTHLFSEEQKISKTMLKNIILRIILKISQDF